MDGKKQKFLVMGSAGMAGHCISLYLHEQGHNVTAFSTRPFPYCNNIVGDAMDQTLVETMLQEGNFDIVINCIGLLNHTCDLEQSRAIYLNSYLPHFIADTIIDMKTKLIHMSTDCVFSGKSGFYDENSFCDGETFYDRTKALGEIVDDKNLTFRNSIIGPDMKSDGIGLFNWFMKQNGIIKGYTKAIWTGVTTLTLAKAIEKAATENLTGLYHLVNNESLSKYDLLRFLNKYMRDEGVIILPCESVVIDKSLINNRKDFSFQIPSYEQMVIEMNEWINGHIKLYPHYFKQRSNLCCVN